jgi:phospholipid/cholesterol/gamma-HCH transport system substrate-binding protein
MRIFRTTRERLIAAAGAAVVLAALLAGAVVLYQQSHRGTQLTAYFSETIGVYPGSTVRVLGVPVGTVDSVDPQGQQVRVVMTIGHGTAVPADAKAVVVAASVISDRYIQLTPAYTGGPRIADGASIPATRTQVPVEVDQLYSSLSKLSTALGPNGANSKGALSDLVKTGAANLAGNGTYLHNMLTQFGALSKTLGNSSGNLFATVSNLQQFTTMLKNNDGQVRQAEQQLAQVSSFLAGDRQDLAGALSQLSTALGQVQGFIASNRALIKSNVSKLAAITSLLSQERASLAEALDAAPLAADNVVNAYDAAHRTLDARGDLNEFSMNPIGKLLSVPGPGSTAPAGSVLVPLSQLSGLPPLPLPVTGPLYGTPTAVRAGARR